MRQISIFMPLFMCMAFLFSFDAAAQAYETWYVRWGGGSGSSAESACAKAVNSISGSSYTVSASFLGYEPGTNGHGGIVGHCKVDWHDSANNSYSNTYQVYCIGAGCMEMMCESPYERRGNYCVATCKVGSPWDGTNKRCIDPEKEKDCRSAHPIGFVEGNKYRSEKALSIGSVFPLSFEFKYNNQGNHELIGQSKLPIINSETTTTIPDANITMGMIGREFSVDNYYGMALTYIADITELIPRDQYVGSTYIEGFYAPGKLEAKHTRFWRHNFDESITVTPTLDGEELVWLRHDGEKIKCHSSAGCSTYPSIHLQRTADGYEIEAGYGQPKRAFDADGRLIRIIDKSGVYHELTYTNGRVSRVSHSLGSYIDIEYTLKSTNSIYQFGRADEYYVSKLTDHTGRFVEVQWAHNATLTAGQYHFISFISHPSVGTVNSGRRFEYNDPRWRVSITDIYDVSDRQAGTEQLYAHFEYDAAGRAVYSGLANGVDSVSIEYPDSNTRKVINALGKVATYNYDSVEGVKRLKSVTGEPTATCVTSETQYTHDASGRVIEKTQNGVTTRYSYNSRSLETERIEAYGTALTRTIRTTWHPTLPLRTQIEESGRVTIFTYDADGKLLSQKISETAM